MKFERLALALLLAASPDLRADRLAVFAIDPAHTRVRFSPDGLFSPVMIFTEVTGSLQGNLDHPERSEVSVSIPVRSLRTRSAFVRRRLLESGDFFRPREFPVMTFRSTGLRDIDRRQGSFALLGNLTVNGIRRPVVLDARLAAPDRQLFQGNRRRTGFSASTRISRSAFGMGKSVPFAGDTLQVQIALEAVLTNAGRPVGER